MVITKGRIVSLGNANRDRTPWRPWPCRRGARRARERRGCCARSWLSL